MTVDPQAAVERSIQGLEADDLVEALGGWADYLAWTADTGLDIDEAELGRLDEAVSAWSGRTGISAMDFHTAAFGAFAVQQQAGFDDAA